MHAAWAQRPRAPPFIDPSGFARHRPENTLLYQLVEQRYQDFRELRARIVPRGVVYDSSILAVKLMPLFCCELDPA